MSRISLEALRHTNKECATISDGKKIWLKALDIFKEEFCTTKLKRVKCLVVGNNSRCQNVLRDTKDLPSDSMLYYLSSYYFKQDIDLVNKTEPFVIGICVHNKHFQDFKIQGHFLVNGINGLKTIIIYIRDKQHQWHSYKHNVKQLLYKLRGWQIFNHEFGHLTDYSVRPYSHIVATVNFNKDYAAYINSPGEIYATFIEWTASINESLQRSPLSLLQRFPSFDLFWNYYWHSSENIYNDHIMPERLYTFCNTENRNKLARWLYKLYNQLKQAEASFNV